MHKSFLRADFFVKPGLEFSRKDLLLYLMVFLCAVALKTVTEMSAYPYPVGYDVINYYIPMLDNFESVQHSLLKEYPFYMYILHFIQSLTGLSPGETVSSFSIVVYGIFALSIFSLGKVNLKNSNVLPVLISLFVIVQIPVLRTAWDLHRDIFSFTMMFFAISFLIKIRNNSFEVKRYYLICLTSCITFAILSVVSDRMVGTWLVSVFCIYSLISRERIVILIFACAAASFIIFVFVTGDGISIITSIIPDAAESLGTNQISGEKVVENTFYNQKNLFTYFVSINGLLVPLAIVGFTRLREPIMRTSILIALIGSMTWLIFSQQSELVADRWILLFGIGLSFFAGYGFAIATQIISRMIRNRYTIVFLSAVIYAAFAQFGIMYAFSSYDSHYSVIGLFDENVERFAPKTMQFNSIRVDQSPTILNTIKWINQNTPVDSKIIGSNDWRGWFVSELEGNRSFAGYEVLADTVEGSSAALPGQTYLVSVTGQDSVVSMPGAIESYSNDLFRVHVLFNISKGFASVP